MNKFKNAGLIVLIFLLLCCMMLVNLYPHFCILLLPTFIGISTVLSYQSYQILKVKKQAFMKAYYRKNSLLYHYFGHFLIIKILSLCFGLLGSVCLVLMLMLPSQGEITLCLILVPFSLYCFRILKSICIANLTQEFAPIIAKKYTAIFCAFCACIAGIYLAQSTASHTTLKDQYQALLDYSNIESLACGWWKETMGFVLLKKAILDVVFAQAQGTLMYGFFVCLYAFGHFTAFMAFSLLCLAGVHLDSQTHKIGFFSTLFFLICLSFALFIASYFNPMVKVPFTYTSLLSSKFLAQNTQYIELGIHGMQIFIDSRNQPRITQRFEKEIEYFRQDLDVAVSHSIDEYFTNKEVIIDAYSQWYFSVHGEYTRLLYTAFGKGEKLAQDYFLALLQAHTPYDLSSHLNGLYDERLRDLKGQMQHTLELFSIQHLPQPAHIQSRFSFDEFTQELDLFSPHQSDGISAVLSASVLGGLILKSSGKFLSKSASKVLGKGMAKKGVSTIVGTGGSMVCGVFAPLCAIGVFVAADYVFNKLDQSLNEEEFKVLMRAGIDEWELQLKNSLASYNAQLSDNIFQLLPFWDKTYKTKE